MVVIIIFALLIRLFNIFYKDDVVRYETIKERGRKLYEIIYKSYRHLKIIN